MAFCGKCGTQIGDGVRFCPSCGAPSGAASGGNQQQQQQYQQQNAGPGFNDAIRNATNTADYTGSYHPQDIADNKVMAILAYLGILVLVPLFAAKESPFSRFHANQGLVLFACEVALSIISMIITPIFYRLFWGMGGLVTLIMSLAGIAMLILAILGIVNAASGKAKELPLIGKMKFIK